MTKFNVLYKGRKIYQDLDFYECTEILDELSSRYYNEEEFDVNEIELEEI